MAFLNNRTPDKQDKELEKLFQEESQMHMSMSNSGGMMPEDANQSGGSFPGQNLQLSKNHSFQYRQYDPEFSSPHGSGLGQSGEIAMDKGFQMSGGASGNAIRDNNHAVYQNHGFNSDFGSNAYSQHSSGFEINQQFGKPIVGGSGMMEEMRENGPSNLVNSAKNPGFLQGSGGYSLEKIPMAASGTEDYNAAKSIFGNNSFNSNNQLFDQKEIPDNELPPAGENIFGERSEQGLLPEGHKRDLPPKKGGCNCVKIECLKYYCDCFRDGAFCDGRCGCKGCKNIPENAERIKNLHKKFAMKNRDKKEKISGVQYTCGCMSSFCENKYCPCNKSGRGCLPSCRCYNCKNIHGVKGKRII